MEYLITTTAISTDDNAKYPFGHEFAPQITHHKAKDTASMQVAINKIVHVVSVKGVPMASRNLRIDIEVLRY